MCYFQLSTFLSSVSLNLPHVDMQGFSKSGVHVQSVLCNPKAQFKFDRCVDFCLASVSCA